MKPASLCLRFAIFVLGIALALFAPSCKSSDSTNDHSGPSDGEYTGTPG